MSIDLTELHISGDEIRPLDFGGMMPSALGGSSSRFGRLGSRYAAQVSTPQMKIEPDGRRWAARLLSARKAGAVVLIHQPELKIGAPGNPAIASTTPAGRLLSLSGLTPGYAIREGQWLNYFDANGQRYADQAEAQVIADASGNAVVKIQELIRTPLSAGFKIDLARPCLEGWIEGDFSIPRSVDRLTSFSFTISEKR